MQREDFSFALSERILVGIHEGVIRGQATFAFREDEFFVFLFDENDFPVERWFPESMISKERTN